MEKLPSSRGCYVCGRENPVALKLEFFVGKDSQVVSEFSIGENYAGYPGMVHGGNIVAILDEIAGRAVTTEDPNRFMVTSQLKVKYLKPVPTNTPLIAIGKPFKKRGRIAVGTSEIRTKEGEVLASCEAFFVEITEQISNGSDPEESGWKVYPND
ncbi:MAG: PaaI family thioesterase [Chloroflexi bacterium]|nr:PaaI family thioesterase [Chloroflexota bacterium]